MLRGSSANTPGEIRIQISNVIFSLQIFALHRKSLTRRDVPRLLDLLQGALGFLPGLARGLMSLGEFGFFLR